MTEDTTQTLKQSDAQWRIEEFEWRRPNDSIRIKAPNTFVFECRTPGEILLLLKACLAGAKFELELGDSRLYIENGLIHMIDSDPWHNFEFGYMDEICQAYDLGNVLLKYLETKLYAYG